MRDGTFIMIYKAPPAEAGNYRDEHQWKKLGNGWFTHRYLHPEFRDIIDQDLKKNLTSSAARRGWKYAIRRVS